MKRLKITVIVLAMLSLTGCIRKYEVSEQQDNAVAEYMAELLLKHDDDYTQKLTPIEEINYEDTSKDEELTPTPKASAEDDNKDIDEVKDDTDTSKGDNSNSQKEYSIAEVIGAKGFDIEYAGYKLAKSYPEEGDGNYFSLDAAEGNKLLVVSFSARNTTEKEQTLDLKKTKISYQLDINIGTVYKPLLSLLRNDLQYIDDTFKKGETKDLLLVFEISEEADISNINLIISKDNKSEIIEIK